MPSKHIKLEITLVSIILFILLTDYTLLLGHPSTRVGLIAKNLGQKLEQRKIQKELATAGRSASARGRRLERTHYLRQYSNNNPITITKTPSSSFEVSFRSVTLEIIPRTWLVNSVQKMKTMVYGGSDDQTAKNSMLRA